MASATSRAVSIAVQPQHSQPANPRRQQRASHSVATSSQPHEDSSQSSPYPDVFHHPAVEAYMAAHPRRTIPRFGPYLLLQTLGEGEFGKVKLGIHVQWGEEVAVKLIRRGNVDTAVRLSKVEREIEVLRTLKHPNIVRLYDVIETDKYIGIILEYASGGELFDHILAHRYLKERDAAKLFSQLISGVWYIHQKKIVHRDLKLENLLLDRNRNVIITDFGFANRFEHKADDLMQTSCGSPCYAAPELVISEGLYVGSAVDIWSCGVILYAMLAGYLPFDDDPANPDGDNINLLYKYIVSTPLSFPDYISADARDLLSMMLVPDPTRRANLDGVMRHRWLSAHTGTPRTDGSPNAFGKSVDELEKAALDQHQQRRLAYQRQMRAAAIAQNNTSPHAREATHSGIPSRSRSTQPEYLYESSADLASPPPVATRSNTTAGLENRPTYGSPSAHGITSDDPFGPPPSAPATTAAATTTSSSSANVPARISEERAPPNGATATATTTSQSSKGHKQNNSGSGGGSGFRHTIQVEYDDRNASGSKKSDERRARAGTDHQTQSQRDRRVSGSTTAAGKPLPVSPPLPIPSSVPPASAKASTTPATVVATVAQQSPVPAPPVKSSSPSTKQKSTAASQNAPALKVGSSPSTAPESNSTDKETSSTASATSSIGKKSAVTPAQTPASKSGEKGHRKGRSSVDRFALSKIFGGGGSGGRASADALAGDEKEREKAKEKGKSKGSLLTASPERYGEKEKEVSPSPSPTPTPTPVPTEKDKKEEKKKSRRNTLTVMVEPISRTIRGGKSSSSKTASTPSGGGPPSAYPTSANPNASASSASLAPPSALPQAPSMPTTPTPSSKGGNIGGGNSAASFGDSSAGADNAAGSQEGVNGGSGNAASSSKAKKVMAWFRTKSKGRDSMGLLGSPNTATPTATAAHSSGEEDQVVNVPQGGGGPELTLTTPTSTTTKIPSTPGPQTSGVTAPGHPKRTASTNTESSVMTFSTPGFVQKIRHSVGVGSGSGSGKHGSMNTPSFSRSRKASSSRDNNNAAPTPTKKPYEKLRIHHGAVDQTTITTRPPVEVMNHVKEILEGMGVEMVQESEFKYRCVRQKRRKGAVNGAGVNGEGVNGHGQGQEDVAAFTMVGSAASNGVDKRGLPLPSQSSFGATGNMLRGLLMRRQSSQVSSSGNNSNPNPNNLAFDDEHSVVISPTADSPTNSNTAASPTSPPAPPVVMMVGETAYGDPSQDAGDEVRFSVELTRIDRLNDTFSLDIRRLKGNLRSYKFLYDTIRHRADLQRLGQ